MSNGILVDTNVLSETLRARPDAAVMRWAETCAEAISVSVVSVGELRFGVESLRGRDPDRAARLELGVAGILAHYGDRLIPLDGVIADLWGRLQTINPGRLLDNFLAATALEHDLAVATRNLRDFERTGVRVVNPWEYDG